ncbi:HEAT repeat domain-containing protein [Paenibacillus sp. GD4]|uniref:HEAT repeat domain-containing protein n=1 Tax=Paenibacillus sp. GD4 TaxID=3068890 RepID=UPI0027965E23|nr:HEAT repeat domain-containing protein [Paenibacillus sp. GD4]MDQ1914158.1 HEAT repeat domain-containing protein [Paenibacillus sp. GD4]
MLDTKYLLTDEQMIHFITKGYLVLTNDLPEQLHRRVMDKIYYVLHEEGNPGNNILPRVPEIQQFFDTPTVKGALTSVLGPDYYMHPHRHCHYNRPGSQTPGGGQWHKDGYWSSMRSHRPWWAMIFYYTQDITEEMGPTAIMPGTQYYEKFLGDRGETLLPTGKAGTMVLVHFDLWHKASLNVSEFDRYMLKFQFTRLREPENASWNHQSPDFPVPDGLPAQHPNLWQDVWEWLRAAVPESAKKEQPVQSPQELGELVSEASETDALNASYTLGRMGKEGIAELAALLSAGTHLTAERAAYGLQAAGSEAVPALLELLAHQDERRRGLAAFVLGMIGPGASLSVQQLIERLQDGSSWVRRNAVEALGMIREPVEQVVPALTEALLNSLQEETNDAPQAGSMYVSQQSYIKNKIGYTAALSLLRTGKDGDPKQVVQALEQALSSGDRYVRAYAAEALSHLRTEEAIDVLVRYCRTSRWCSDTSKASTF